MKIYLVRHGESEGNRKNVFQSAESPLTDIGHMQANLVAHRFKTIPIDEIISSDNTRALETAQHIREATQKPIKTTALLREGRRPSEINGMLYDDPRATKIIEQLDAHQDDPEWHYSDEDNYHDLITRATEALRYLSAQKSENIAVVSHSVFIRFMLWSILQPPGKSYSDYIYFHKSLHTSNAGISVCEYKHDAWRVLTINDDAHLG